MTEFTRSIFAFLRVSRWLRIVAIGQIKLGQGCRKNAWALKKAQGKKFDVAEMNMLKWMCGVTKLDRIRNERIRAKPAKVRINLYIGYTVIAFRVYLYDFDVYIQLGNNDRY